MSRGRPRNDGDRPPLSIEDVLAVGRRITANSSLGALTLKAVADELGVTPAAIYHYVPSRAALCSQVAESVIAGIDISTRKGPWDQQLERVLASIRDTLRRYPGVTEHWLETSPDVSAGWRCVDAVLEVLLAAGLPPGEAFDAFALLFTFTNGQLLLAPERALSSAQPPRDPNGYPLTSMRIVVHGLGKVDPEAQFRYGLRILLDGLRDRIDNLMRTD